MNKSNSPFQFFIFYFIVKSIVLISATSFYLRISLFPLPRPLHLHGQRWSTDGKRTEIHQTATVNTTIQFPASQQINCFKGWVFIVISTHIKYCNSSQCFFASTSNFHLHREKQFKQAWTILTFDTQRPAKIDCQISFGWKTDGCSSRSIIRNIKVLSLFFSFFPVNHLFTFFSVQDVIANIKKWHIGALSAWLLSERTRKYNNLQKTFKTKCKGTTKNRTKYIFRSSSILMLAQ